MAFFRLYHSLRIASQLLLFVVALISCKQSYEIFSIDTSGNRHFPDGTVVQNPDKVPDDNSSKAPTKIPDISPAPPTSHDETDTHNEDPVVDTGHRQDEEINPGFMSHSVRYDISVDKKKIDVLFVIDNSGSMHEEQKNVQDSFNLFLQGFLDEDVDFHIGVISTDVSGMNELWNNYWNIFPYKAFNNNGPGTLLSKKGNDRFLNNKLSAFEIARQFRENVDLGTSGSPAEMGVASVIKFLEPNNISNGGWNQGFLRSDALLSIIFVSDEDESLNTLNLSYLRSVPKERIKRVQSLLNRLNEIKPGRPDLLRADAVVAPSYSECQSVGVSNGIHGTGDVYIEVVNKLKGTSPQSRVTNICNDFSADLGGLSSELAVQVERRFKLKHEPIGKLIVSLDGQNIPENQNNGFSFDENLNEIILNGLQLEDKERFSVEIKYAYKKM
jgi:hypothetical protein